MEFIGSLLSAVGLVVLVVFFHDVSPCDRELQIWTLTAVANFVAGMILTDVFFVFRLLGAVLLVLSLTFFGVCWTLYGIVPVFVNDWCDKGLHITAIVLWSLSVMITLLQICAPLWMGPPFDVECPAQPMPENVMSNIEAQPWSEARIKIGKREACRPLEATVAAVPPRAKSERHICLGTLAAPGRSTVVAHQPPPPLFAVSKRASWPLTMPVIVEEVAKRWSRPHRRKLPQDTTCPICFVEFETEDPVICLPCDIRHVYHQDCVKAWFQRSRACPVCRVDICSLVLQTRASEEEEANQGRGRREHSRGPDRDPPSGWRPG